MSSENETSPTPDEPVKRKRGRPRKIPADQYPRPKPFTKVVEDLPVFDLEKSVTITFNKTGAQVSFTGRIQPEEMFQVQTSLPIEYEMYLCDTRDHDEEKRSEQ